jgi:hypothetical protein
MVQMRTIYCYSGILGVVRSVTYLFRSPPDEVIRPECLRGGMMGSTHAAMGLVLALPVAVQRSEWALPVALAAIAGSLLPDLDLFVGEHRRTLHYPVYGWVPTLAALGVAAAWPSAVTVALAVGFAAAALHALVDGLGGQTGGRPWEADGSKGVYAHAARTWVRPRRWIRYDGAPEDLVACYLLAVPSLLVFDGIVRTLAVLGLVVATLFVAVRKRLPSRGDAHPR